MPRRPGLPTALGLVLATHPFLVVGAIGASYAAVMWGFEGVLGGLVFVALQSAAERARGPRGVPGPLATPASQPELAGLVRRVAESIGFAEPLVVSLVPGPDAGLGRTRIHGAPVVLLVLGLPLVLRLSEAELAAVVAHELGHRHHLDDRKASLVMRARQALADKVDDGATVPRLLGAGLLRRTQPVSFEFELECDAKAAQATGSAAVRGALAEVEAQSAVFYGMAARWADDLEEQGKYPADLVDAFLAAATDPLVRDRVLAEERPVDPADSHPSRAQRSAALGSFPERGYGAVPVPLRGVEELKESVLADLVDVELRPVSVLEDPSAVESRPELAREVVEDIAGTADLRALLDRFDHRPLELPYDAEQALAGAAARLVSVMLLERGWTRASRWSSSVLVDPAGVVQDLRGLMTEALRTKDGRDRVRALVAS